MRLRRTVIGVALSALLWAALTPAQAARKPGQKAPWWKEQKIVFMWGQWPWYLGVPTEPRSEREQFRNIGLAGATVFADTWTAVGWVQQDGRAVPATETARRRAGYAHEFGVKYFDTLFVSSLQGVGDTVPGARKAITKTGELSYERRSWCPLDQTVYEKWTVEPYLELARERLLDGIHFDWEYYGGNGEAAEAMPCYCDDCFARFLDFKGMKETLPEKAKRFPWLKERNLTGEYEGSFHARRVEMFTGIRKKLQAANPNLLISSYGTFFSDFTRAMNTPQTPFIFLDSRHYGTDSRKPWWESYSARLKQEGYLYIPGGWTNALFGAQPSQVSAARWIYEASINEDGCWLWFERVLDDEILRAYASASREIKAVQERVGEFLFQGKRDPNFATAVEWSGRPEVDQAVITRTYHLGNEHLAQISNTDSEWPLRTRIRFPRLAGSGLWTVRDAMSNLHYSRDGTSAVWTTEQLRAGVVVSMEPRSDMFLQVSPTTAKLKVASSRLLQSNEFDALPPHAAAAANAGSAKALINLYTLKNSIYAEKLDSLLPSTEKLLDLPKTGWHFKMDKEDVGAGAGWYVPQAALEGWIPIEIEDFWGAKGGSGAGWYRADVAIPALPEGKRIYLHFGAVDEHLVVWIDGVYAGDYDRLPGEGWDQPFAIDVTGKLTAGRHHLALRVFNSSAAGGVWKPISVLAGPAVPGVASASATSTDGGASGRLLYTSTEPMRFEGAEGGLTIGNAIRSVDTRYGIGPRLRQLRGHLWSPRYSPDGSRVAFVHDAGGRGQIYVMKDDGSGAINLSHNDFCDRFPVWSPDGTRIAFLSDRTGDWDVYTMDPDGSGQKLLAGNPGVDRAPAWSPDGKQVAWESYTSGMPSIWVCDADGKNSRPLIAPDKPIEIEQVEDGEKKDGVFNFAVVENPFPDNSFFLTNPSWSPDGKSIAAVLDGRGGYQSDVVLVRVDGARMLKLTNYIGCSGELIWSPDGKRLAGAFRCPNESERSGLFVISADRSDGLRGGKNVVDVTPLGPRIGGGQRHGLLSWYSHGSAQPRRVVKSFCSVAWSADGKTLAFSSDLDPTGAFYVYTVPVDGGKPERIELTKSAWPNQIMWWPSR
jgi:Tol biopolymer transport system component